jgi:DNA-binding MarR family transcriptional regulator
MTDARTANLLGALVVALDDDITAAISAATDHGAAFPAALVSIHWQPGSTIEALRRKLGLSHSGTVRLLDRLEADGSIERRAGKDGRSVSLALSDKGRRQVRSILASRRRVLAKTLERLSPGERRTLAGLLETMLGEVTRDRTHADRICRLCDEGACSLADCPVEAAARP